MVSVATPREFCWACPGSAKNQQFELWSPLNHPPTSGTSIISYLSILRDRDKDIQRHRYIYSLHTHTMHKIYDIYWMSTYSHMYTHIITSIYKYTRTKSYKWLQMHSSYKRNHKYIKYVSILPPLSRINNYASRTNTSSSSNLQQLNSGSLNLGTPKAQTFTVNYLESQGLRMKPSLFPFTWLFEDFQRGYCLFTWWRKLISCQFFSVLRMLDFDPSADGKSARADQIHVHHRCPDLEKVPEFQATHQADICPGTLMRIPWRQKTRLCSRAAKLGMLGKASNKGMLRKKLCRSCFSLESWEWRMAL